MDMFFHGEPFRKPGRRLAFPQAEDCNGPNVSRKIENFLYIVLCERSYPASMESSSMGSEHHECACYRCILQGIEYASLSVPGHRPDVIGADDEEVRRLPHVLLPVGCIRELFPDDAIIDEDDIPSLEIACTRCCARTVEDVPDIPL